MNCNRKYFYGSGECRDIPPCDADELDDFPRRMRDWLINVMAELADRKELSYFYQEMKKKAEVIKYLELR